MSRRKVYITGYSSRDDEKDIKKIFKKYGKIDEVSWKGRFCFLVFLDDYNLIIRHSEIMRTLRELSESSIDHRYTGTHWWLSSQRTEALMMAHATPVERRDICKISTLIITHL